MEKKKLMGLFGSAVLFGSSTGGIASSHMGEGACAGMIPKEKKDS